MSSVKKGSKEFYEVIDAFEASVKSMPIFVTIDFTKEDKDNKGIPATHFYCNGQINSLFLVFMAGYVAAKKEYQ